MGCWDQEFFFSDNQDVASGTLSDTSAVKATNAAYNAASPKDTWGVAKALQLGGDVEWTVIVSDETFTGSGAALLCELMTKAADSSVSSGATQIASIKIPALSAIGFTRSVKLTAGTEILAYLSVLYTAAGGNLTAGHITSYIGPAAEENETV